MGEIWHLPRTLYLSSGRASCSLFADPKDSLVCPPTGSGVVRPLCLMHCHQVMRGLLWQGVTAYPVAKEYLTRKAELGMEAEVTLLFSPKVCCEKF